jgi:hypothetical protein
MVTDSPLGGGEATEKFEWSTARHKPGAQPVQRGPEARDQARRETRAGGETRETQKSARLKDAMGLSKNPFDIVLGQKVEDVRGYESIIGLGRLLVRRSAIGEDDLRPGGERGESTLGEADHRGADIDCSIGRVWRKMLG